MTATGEERAGGRILVALDSSVRGQAALQTAARLAMEQHTELVALFVEDLDLVHLAGLPFAREVDRASALERPLDSMRMDRSLRAQAEQIRYALEQSALSLSVKVSLRVVRGQFVSAAFSEATERDLLILARMGGTVFARPPRLAPQRETRAPAREDTGSLAQPRVAVVCDGSAQAGRALIVAGNLARSDRGSVLVVYTAADREVQNVKTAAATVLRAITNRVRYTKLPDNDIRALAAVINREGCDLLVLNRSAREQDPAGIHRLVGEVDCAVILVP